MPTKEQERLHDWSLAKIKRLYNPKGNEGWLNIHLWVVIKQAYNLGIDEYIESTKQP